MTSFIAHQDRVFLGALYCIDMSGKEMRHSRKYAWSLLPQVSLFDFTCTTVELLLRVVDTIPGTCTFSRRATRVNVTLESSGGRLYL